MSRSSKVGSLPHQIILFTTRAPDPLAEKLIREGMIVYEALAISEVLALAQDHPSAQIILAPGIDAARARIIQQRYPTVKVSQDGL
ncbi:MAG TPA: hypothetical protein VJW20_20330 [Candidatus Angelobacter sp.]|nr:hypothetical protein [Candidatus Angelobacter sp.]